MISLNSFLTAIITVGSILAYIYPDAKELQLTYLITVLLTYLIFYSLNDALERAGQV